MLVAFSLRRVHVLRMTMVAATTNLVATLATKLASPAVRCLVRQADGNGVGSLDDTCKLEVMYLVMPAISNQDKQKRHLTLTVALPIGPNTSAVIYLL